MVILKAGAPFLEIHLPQAQFPSKNSPIFIPSGAEGRHSSPLYNHSSNAQIFLKIF